MNGAFVEGEVLLGFQGQLLLRCHVIIGALFSVAFSNLLLDLIERFLFVGAHLLENSIIPLYLIFRLVERVLLNKNPSMLFYLLQSDS